MSKVAVLRTSPSEVLKDYQKLMSLAECDKALSKSVRTVLKLNLSWTLYFPACSTAPWQLDGALCALKSSGYKDLLAVENQTVVTHPWRGAYNNRWLPVLDKHGVEFQPLTDVEWVDYQPRSDMLAMDKLFPRILVPKLFLGSNMIHLPTMKTHGHTTTTGAMKNAFGGLIPRYRHHAHLMIHEVLVDLLAVQKEIHKGLFAAMDGCIAGNGAGPRTMQPFCGNIILASSDQVAIDAVSARIMGFDPMSIGYIRMAHERGLGTGDIDQIEVTGMDGSEFKGLNFGFKSTKSPIILWDQRIRKSTAGTGWLYDILFRSPIFRLFISCSEIYHDRIWYPRSGQKAISGLGENGWLPLMESYDKGKIPDARSIRDWDPY